MIFITTIILYEYYKSIKIIRSCYSRGSPIKMSLILCLLCGLVAYYYNNILCLGFKSAIAVNKLVEICIYVQIGANFPCKTTVILVV